MKKLALLPLLLAVGLAAVPVAADHPGGAQPRDVQRLQDELFNLEDSLRGVSTSHPRYVEFRDRAEQIREDVTYIKVQMRRHQQNRREGLGASLEDVNWVRDTIRSLQSDVDRALNRRFSGGAASIPEGTQIFVRLDTPLSSGTARVEDRFEATVVRSVLVDGRVVIPSGSLVRGTVRRAQRAQRPVRGGELELAFDSILVDNVRTDLSGRVVSIEENIDRSETGERAGIGAALGAILGSVIGGKKGALVGILVGGAGGAISSKGEEVELPAGTVLTLSLDRPLSLRR